MFAVCLAATAAFAHTVDAHATEQAGASALRQARAAWDQGAVSAAEPLYRQALEEGGLAPSEVLEGYVRLGAARAATGKKDQAIAAFRAASILDPNFAVPPEAGPRGNALAAQARKDTAKVGGIQFALSAPRQAASGRPFTVLVQLDSAHVPIIKKIVLVARDGTSGREATVEAPVGSSAEIEIPSTVTLPGADLTLRADAKDAHDNRLASTEERVHVSGGRAASASASTHHAPTTEPDATNARNARETPSRSAGFWSSPWPYVIGSVALASAGAAVYFGTRPPDEVSVGAVNVQPR